MHISRECYVLIASVRVNSNGYIYATIQVWYISAVGNVQIKEQFNKCLPDVRRGPCCEAWDRFGNAKWLQIMERKRHGYSNQTSTSIPGKTTIIAWRGYMRKERLDHICGGISHPDRS